MGRALDRGHRQAVTVDIAVVAQKVAERDRLVCVRHADIGTVVMGYRRVVDRGDIDIDRPLRRRVAVRQGIGDRGRAVEIRVRYELDMVADDRRRAAAATGDARNAQRIAFGVVVVGQQAGQGDVDRAVFGGRRTVGAGDGRRIDDVGAVRELQGADIGQTVGAVITVHARLFVDNRGDAARGRNGVVGHLAREDRRVAARTAVQRIVAGAADQGIVTGIAGHRVETSQAFQQVVAAVAVDGVVENGADQRAAALVVALGAVDFRTGDAGVHRDGLIGEDQGLNVDDRVGPVG